MTDTHKDFSGIASILAAEIYFLNTPCPLGSMPKIQKQRHSKGYILYLVPNAAELRSHFWVTALDGVDVTLKGPQLIPIKANF